MARSRPWSRPLRASPPRAGGRDQSGPSDLRQEVGFASDSLLEGEGFEPDAAAHNVTAQENLVKQLRQDRDYASVVAPFDGVITQRNVDVGSLVQGNATSGTLTIC